VAHAEILGFRRFAHRAYPAAMVKALFQSFNADVRQRCVGAATRTSNKGLSIWLLIAVIGSLPVTEYGGISNPGSQGEQDVGVTSPMRLRGRAGWTPTNPGWRARKDVIKGRPPTRLPWAMVKAFFQSFKADVRQRCVGAVIGVSDKCLSIVLLIAVVGLYPITADVRFSNDGSQGGRGFGVNDCGAQIPHARQRCVGTATVVTGDRLRICESGRVRRRFWF